MNLFSEKKLENKKCDYLIIGGGIVGLTIANQLIQRKITNQIVIIDKEKELGLHSSGRNSGVLHAGIYYEPGSLKAKVCVSGANRLKDWMSERGLKIKKCGKLIIPQKKELDPQLDNLFNRGKKNGALISFVNAREIEEIVPEANITSGRGIWSPNTSVVNPLDVINQLKKELREVGVKIITNAKNWTFNRNESYITLDQNIQINFGYVINSSGLYADQVAHKFNVAKDYKIIPFKGIYWKLRNNSPFNIDVNLYPVPDLNVPFLGVHFTPNASNNVVSIGPTAIPAFGRENYNIFQNIQPINAILDLSFLGQQYFLNKGGFRKYVNDQALQGFPLLFLKAAQELIPKIKYHHIEPSKKVGLRAQLFNLKNKTIVKDFLCINGTKSTHIVNSISPAFTASFSFADYVIDNYVLPNINK